MPMAQDMAWLRFRNGGQQRAPVSTSSKLCGVLGGKCSVDMGGGGGCPCVSTLSRSAQAWLLLPATLDCEQQRTLAWRNKLAGAKYSAQRLLLSALPRGKGRSSALPICEVHVHGPGPRLGAEDTQTTKLSPCSVWQERQTYKQLWPRPFTGHLPIHDPICFNPHSHSASQGSSFP